MTATSLSLTLPEDIVFSPVESIAPSLRQRIGATRAGDVAVSRPRARQASKIVSAEAADLLQLFRQPRTIAEAVVEYCRGNNADPETILGDAFPVISDFVNEKFLLARGAKAGEAITADWKCGERIGRFVLKSRIQLLVDTEIYQARDDSGAVFAIKVTRAQAGPSAAARLAHEARMIRAVGGAPCPKLIDVDVVDNRAAFLALEWCQGASIASVAAEHRAAGDTGALVRLGRRMLEAYARLHARGVLHGDIHPGNILVDASDRAWLIDFGLATRPGHEDSARDPGRGGVAFFHAPEYAAAVLAENPPPPVTPESEQYSLAALVYHLMTGVYTHDFSLEREVMLRQIAGDPPVEFSRQGIEVAPPLEDVIRRALSKAPGDRFPSVAAFAEALREAAPPPRPNLGTNTPASPLSRILDGAIARCDWEGDLLAGGLARAPKASINYGAAGIAWFLHRLARVRGDADKLALADVWLDRARQAGEGCEGFYNPEIEISEQTVGRISPYHTASGLVAMDALVAHARGDSFAREEALRRFATLARGETDQLDVTLGRSGVVLVAALLARSLGDLATCRETGVLGMAHDHLEKAWRRLDEYPGVDEAVEVPLLGAAHGWAGFIYAALAWSAATGESVPSGVERRLRELAAEVEFTGRGARWPWQRDRDQASHMPGWCNGSAGYVLLGTLAHRVLGDEHWRELAEKAAWNCWEDPALSGSLCCGLAGRAYALLNLFKSNGDGIWVDRARRLALRAAEGLSEELRQSEARGFENSLYKGELGVATLVADLEQPECAALPFFEAEDWMG